MAAKKTYFHDHLVLLLLSITAFLTIAVTLLVLVKLGTGESNSFIVQCRDCSNPSAINRFTSGGVANLLSFIGFSAVVLTASTVLSMRAYKVHRQLAIVILALGVLLLILAVIISNALLTLR